MTQHTEVDLVVIGTGGAAMSAAIHARLEGASVVAIESGTLGGTCVNVGCVPSKTLLAAAHTRHSALTNPFSGAPSSAGMVDLSALIEQKDDLVGMLRQTKYADIAAAYAQPYSHLHADTNPGYGRCAPRNHCRILRSRRQHRWLWHQFARWSQHQQCPNSGGG